MNQRCIYYVLTQLNFAAFLKVRQNESKRFFQADVSSQKRTKSILLLCMKETSSRLVFVRFLEEIEDTKKTFRNKLTYTTYILTYKKLKKSPT